MSHRAWCRGFIEVLSKKGSVQLACDLAGISKATAYEYRDQCLGFRSEWQQALREYERQAFEETAHRLAKMLRA